MRGRRGFQRGHRAIYCQLGSVYGAPATDSIGHRGWLCGVASCAESREQVSYVGGWLVRLRHERFPRECGQNSVPWGHVSASRGRARATSCLLLGVMQVCMKRGARRGAGA
jgi:hypothetical protein